jgi:amino acid adenylation domain-containing protein
MKSPLITDLIPEQRHLQREPAEAPGGLELPADRPRPPVASFCGVTRELLLTAALTARLRQAAERERASLDVLLLAGLAALLARYSGAEDLVIGAKGPTGLLPLRIQWTGDPTFQQLVAAADGALSAALAKADLLPFQVVFIGTGGTGTGAERLPSGERRLAVDLAFSVREVGGGEGEPPLLVALDYAVDLFDATTAARLLAHYAALLAGAAAGPELPLSRLPLLGEAERHQMLVEWNDTASAFPRRALHKLFEEQAAARPDAVAVVWDGGALSYGELDRQAGRIARRLRRLGVGPESRVALYLERSPEMVAAVLGILKAGGAYLPIDLSYPRERLELLLEDAAPAAVVGTTRSLASLPSKAPQLAVDLLAVHPAPAAAAELSADVPPESLAYVLYTSGSTGTPNGVEVSHEAVVRLVRETEFFPFGPEDVFLQMALLSFDASTLELWGPLANGGCVALPPPGRFALGDLYEQVARHGVTAIFLTTGLFHVAVEEGLAGLAGLRHLLTGGDVMSRAHLERAIAALPEVELIHCYGPTENTVFTSTWRVRRPLAEGSVTIGRPISTVRAYVLDAALAPVPMGSAGELYLSGPGLARGYLHRRELTAERFLPNPFEPNAFEATRLYKTGDLVRWRPDGTLAFLGRHDFQVKVRGFRIEPGEIEAALLRHPEVREAAVVGLAEGGRDHRVVAYYVTEAGAETSREDLRAFLRARLPEHMVPAVLVPLAALPLTNVGKLDRRALPSPEALEPAAGEPVARDPSDLGDLVMEMLAGLWEDVLDPDPQRGPAAGGAPAFERSALEKSRRIGAHDDFFDLGGHSLTVMRLLSRIRRTFGVELGAQTVFAFPTLAAQARVIAGARRGAESALPPLVKVPRQGMPALSFAQQRLWFLDRLAPESPLYNVPSAYRLAGPLAPAALAAGLCEIVRRHEALRTRFVEVDGEPRQEIGAPWEVPLPQVDLRALGRERRSGELARLRAEEAGRPFRLDRGPLLRAGLVRLDEEEHVLLLTVHHIVYDGWSEGVLIAELTTLYAAALAGRPSPLGELTVQYADFAAWQRAWPPEVLGRQLAWWRDELAGAPAALPLPVDRQRPAAPSFRGASAMLRLPAAATAALRRAARREGTTLYMLLLAGFAALLARVTGEEDLLVGTPVADRPLPEVEGLIGFFVNTVVIRARAAGDPSFRGLLAAVRDTALSAFAHQDLPFEMLVEELRPERERLRNPLVQVLFTFQGAGQAAAGTAGMGDGAAGLRLVRLPWGERSTAKVDLLLSAMEMPAEGGLENRGESDEAEVTLVLEYAADLFTATTAARLLGHYATLVAGAAASPTSPELPLSSLPLLSAPERHQLVAEWNDTASGFPERSVHGLFADQASARPDAVAVAWEGGAMTYGELDRRSGEIARHLRRLGVAPEAINARVGLVVERSPEMVAALLGILKAGGGYLPLDPSYPRERLALLLADAAPAAVVGPRHLLSALPEIPNGAPRLAFEDVVLVEASEADTGADAHGGVDVLPASLAYVLYTSGSTGTPKGVEVSHRAVVRLVRETGYAVFGPGEVFLQAAPMSFDVATFEIWGPLLNGGCLALLPPGPFTLAGLYAAVVRHGVTTLWLTSGLFHLAVEEGLAPLGGLRQLLAGGDVLSRPHLERALAALPGVDLINGYGPTENTSFSTTHHLRGGLAAGEASVPIGRPIAGSHAYVLDRSLRPLPVACVGELYVGGAGVARGYLGHPALTAERFLPDPFSANPSGEDRLYHTGDLARWRPDGTLDFLGRRDFQVKVRGFRVEPGEVESALLLHPGVREAVVTAAAEAGGGHRLVAWYVPEGADGPAPVELRAHLQESLPEHMVPSLFVPLAELPLNANGKVDRRALPAPEAQLAGEARSAGEAEIAPRTPPRNPVEEVIAGIWEDLLGLDPLKQPVGVDDDFFHLGGHSLLVIRLLSRLRQAFGADLPVQRVFAAPTVAGLAAAIGAMTAMTAAGRREEATPLLPPIVPLQSRHGVLPLSYPQLRFWFMDRLAPESPTYNIPSCYLLRGPLAPAALAAALAEIVRRHEALRTRFVAVAHGEPGQEIGPPPPTPPAPLPLADLSALPPARRAPELAALGGREARRVFDLQRGPMFRATLVRLGQGEHALFENEHALLLTLHHIAADGWSEGVLRRELSTLYAAALAGEPSPLAPLPLQYADFAAWQRAWPEEALAAPLAHWKERLAGTPALDLPADRPRPPVASFRGDSLRLDLPPALTGALRRLALRGQATVFMIVLAAWHALLQRHSGQTDFAVGTPVANRTRPELEPLIGVFLNMLALRTDGGGDPTFAELLARVRRTALEAYDHADVPFERIVDEVKAARDRSRQPLVQTMLALNSTPRVPIALRGLEAEPLHLSPRVSRFDLSLGLAEQGGGLGGGLEYSTDLFDRTTMERLAACFLRLLAAAADDPSRRVAAIELLSPAERQQVVVELNDTAADFSGLVGGGEPLLHRWIERQAALTPGATAVVGEGESLTYRELDARANRLARRLRRMGVRVDEPVAICAERSPALVVGLLAILKAGGAYLPLDPSYPSERLAFMIEDGLDGVAKPVLLAQVDLLAASVAGAGARLVDLDIAARPAAGPVAGPVGDADDPLSTPLDGGAGADNLAYVIYTSGSTGRPKGVMSTHRGIVNRIAWMQRAYGLTPADRVLQKTPVSFDVSVWELFWPLAVGARLVLARPGGHRDPAYLMRRIEEQEVTTLHFVPSMLQVFLAHLSQAAQAGLGRCRSVRRVLASGEALPAELAARFHELQGGAQGTAETAELHNLYGPTEASVDVTAHRTLPGPARRTVPIGRPISNLGIWLLDPELQPVPLGVPGELYIGGIGGTGLARGYLRRPGLTAERFVPHPLGRPGERLYRTGDLARFSADGEIEFLGRTDDQVKLRGFRIEPGEIEAALAAHPAIREAAVVAREEQPGEVRLAAWVVPAGPGAGPEAGELRDALRRVLPEHMVPADFALVDALPLTPSGKVDRGALRARPPAGGPAPTAPTAEPGGDLGDLETELEQLVAGIWQDLLKRGPIGRDDNLFDAGAHSILAVQFTSHVYDALGLEIPLRLLFEAPTVRRLGAAIQELLIEQIDSLTDEEAALLAE